MSEQPPRPHPAWRDVLDHIEASLAQRLQQTPAPAGKAEPSAPPPELLRPLDERLLLWRSCLEQVEANAAAADANLVEDEAALAGWLEQASKAREMLSRVCAGEIG
jgi:hypothetical protein